MLKPSIYLYLLILCGCSSALSAQSFRICFLTDFHATPMNGAPRGMARTMDSVNVRKPDLVITGGDLVFDAMAVSYDTAAALFDLYSHVISRVEAPVFNTPGNHDVFGWTATKATDTIHEDYGKGMFSRYLGCPYYTFDHQGWRFFVLDNIAPDSSLRGYKGMVDADQLQWLRQELDATPAIMPVAIVCHIPLVTAYTSYFEGNLSAPSPSLAVVSSRQILDLFSKHNLRLVLQGHLHIYENILIDNIRFITGGAVCGAWWQGDNEGTSPGFVDLWFDQSDIKATYIHSGGKASK